jgi:hypothetical protein
MTVVYYSLPLIHGFTRTKCDPRMSQQLLLFLPLGDLPTALLYSTTARRLRCCGAVEQEPPGNKDSDATPYAQ